MHPTRFASVAAAAALLGLTASAQLHPGDDALSLGPKGGSAPWVVAHPTNPQEVLVIQYTQGLYRSTDGGVDFQAYGAGLGNGIRDLVQDPQNPLRLYTMDDTVIFKSEDFGATWNIGNLFAIEKLKDIDLPTSGNSMLACDVFNVYRSDDGGATWTTVHTVVPYAGEVIVSVHFAPSDPSVAYVASTKGVVRSTDGGATFTSAGPYNEWSKAFAVSPTSANLIFSGTPFDGVWRSVDGGANFIQVGLDLTPGDNGYWFAWEPDGSRLWYGLLDGVVYTADQGNTWVDAGAGLADPLPIPTDMAFDAAGGRFLGSESGGLGSAAGGGLYHMASGDSSWTHLAFGYLRVIPVMVASPGGQRVIGLGNGVYAAPKGGDFLATSWAYGFGASTFALAVDPQDSTRWVTGGVGSFSDNAQIVVLTGNGSAYSKNFELFGANRVYDIEFDPFDANRVLAGLGSFFPYGQNSLILSTDSGDSWTQISGTVEWFTVDVAFDPHTQDRVLQLSYDNRWSESTDGGLTWTPLQASWPGTGIAAFLEFDPHQPGVLYYGETAGGLRRSDDDGATWQPLGIGVHEHSTLGTHPEMPGVIWVGDGSGNLLVSADRGDNFVAAWSAPAGSLVTGQSLDLAGDSLLVGTTASSTWELPSPSPFLSYGTGTPGTGGVIPRHFAAGLPQVGNASFELVGDRTVGGAIVYQIYGLGQTAIPILGGVLAVATPVGIVGTVANGAPGVAGDGSYSLSLPIPNKPNLVGVDLTSQALVVDLGVAGLDPVAWSPGLRTTILP